MAKNSWAIITCLLATVVVAKFTIAAGLPVVPVGMDAYLMWDRWPQQRIGVRAYMASTYDRAGGNEGADAGHFLYQREPNRNVVVDVAGRGMLYFCRFNHWHGSPWHYVIDGTDNIVTETSTADPHHPVLASVFEPASAFPQPLTQTWAVTRGADLSWVPMGFLQSLEIDYERTHYGTGYFVYDKYLPGMKLSRPLSAWDEKAAVDPRVIELFARAGTDLSPKDCAQQSGAVTVPTNHAVTIAHLTGPSTIRALELTVDKKAATDASWIRLRISWDGRHTPSIDAPLGLFFGAGVFFNRDDREFLVKAFPVNVRYDADKVHMACYFPMPFFHVATIELVGSDAKPTDIQWNIRTAPLHEKPSEIGYFHATYADHGQGIRGKDLVLLDTRQTAGGGDWSGNFVGTSIIFSHEAVLNTLEGDPRFFFDDSQTPQAQGTGTEEWCGGGDYWGGQNMTLPWVGHPCGARNAALAKSDLDKIESAYRFLLADLMPFGRNAKICLEHGGTDEGIQHYQTVAYWYGSPAASLIPTDELLVGDSKSEEQHAYQSPTATKPYQITSRYEWGVDHLKDQEIYPPSTDTGRVMQGVSEFTMALEPDNVGVMLRRKLDYQFMNQRAEVFVSEPGSDHWDSAGIWYTAGSNTCVRSNPKDELGAWQHKIETSNRRFRDDEFLIGPESTHGKKTIRIRIKFLPDSTLLFPGGPSLPSGWSEMRYKCYCFVIPRI